MAVGRLPVGVLTQVGLPVALDQARDDLGDDPADDGTKVLAAGGVVRLTDG